MAERAGGDVTLATIAERAGVHVSTVSRALRTPARQARPRTREILRIADELGYRPHPIASALRLGRTRSLGVLVPRLTDYILARIYEGIDDVAEATGYTTFVGNTADAPSLRIRRMEEFLARRPEGLILGDARRGGDDAVRELARRSVPYVLTSRRLRGHLSVTNDDLLGGRLAGDHLAILGHRRVAVVAGEPYASTGVERTAGFLRAMASADRQVPAPLVLHSRFDEAGGREAAEELLRREPGLTAIFAVNDTAAIGVMGAVRASGRRIGHDVAIVGYNDIPLAAQLPIPLTSVYARMFEVGRAAAEVLIDHIEGREVTSQLLAPSLRVRESSQPH